MIHYQVTMQHDESTLQALAHMQYDLFNRKNLVVRTIISFAALAVGVLNYNQWWGALLLAYGAYMSSSKYAQANHTANKMVKGIKNAGIDFPVTRYVFREHAVEIIGMPENKPLRDPLKYSEIYKIGEDARHFYLFRDQYGGYTVPKQELSKQVDEFRKFLEERAGQECSTGARKAPIVRVVEFFEKRKRK